MKRRDFLAAGAAASAGLMAGTAALSRPALGGTLARPGMKLGHALRDGRIGRATPVAQKVAVLIVGGGVAGLSAAYALSKAGMHDYLLLELEDSVGGNAAWGENRFTRYPWGAHYLPLPSRESMHVRRMLHEFGILQDGVESEEPVYHERFLCTHRKSVCSMARPGAKVYSRWKGSASATRTKARASATRWRN